MRVILTRSVILTRWNSRVILVLCHSRIILIWIARHLCASYLRECYPYALEFAIFLCALSIANHPCALEFVFHSSVMLFKPCRVCLVVQTTTALSVHIKKVMRGSISLGWTRSRSAPAELGNHTLRCKGMVGKTTCTRKAVAPVKRIHPVIKELRLRRRGLDRNTQAAWRETFPIWFLQ